MSPKQDASEGVSTGQERRAAIRHPCELEGACKTITDMNGWPATVRNISSTGVALALSRRFEPRSLLTVDVETATEPVSMIVRVVHAKQDPNGGWLLGCAFTRNLSEADLASILKS